MKMKTYLLDTNILIALFSKYQAETVKRFLAKLRRTRSRLATCGIVVAEFYQGVSPENAEYYSFELDKLVYLPASRSCFEKAGFISYRLKKAGKTTPLADCFIAACAKEYHATIVTMDQDFKRIPGIRAKFLKK